MRVAVTGATGFIGSHLARGLIAAGHRVTVVTRPSSNRGRLKAIEGQLDFFVDGPGHAEALFESSSRWDAFIHLATRYARSGEGWADQVEANVVQPMRWLEAAERAGVPLFLNTDSWISRYPLSAGPHASYARTKRQFAEWGAAVAQRGRIRFLNLFLFHPYGPGDGEGKFIPRLIADCLAAKAPISLTKGEQTKDFLHVDDVVAAYLTVLKRWEEIDASVRDIEVGAGVGTPLRRFIEEIRLATGGWADLRFGAIDYPLGEVMESKANPSQLMALGWSPRISLEEGVRRTVAETVGVR